MRRTDGGWIEKVLGSYDSPMYLESSCNSSSTSSPVTPTVTCILLPGVKPSRMKCPSSPREVEITGRVVEEEALELTADEKAKDEDES